MSNIASTCKWHKNGYHMPEHEHWETSCGNYWPAHKGGPEENRWKFCPFCSDLIEEVTE